MSEPVVVKKHPVVIIKNLVILQFAAAAVYFVAGVLANYGEIYKTFSFSQSISYEIAKFALVSVAELFLVGYIFLRWFFDSATIYPDMAVIDRGLLWKRRTTIPFSGPLAVSCHYGLLARIFKHGTLVIKYGGEKPLLLSNVQHPESCRMAIREIAVREAHETHTDNIRELLNEREHERLEFKTSFRFDAREGKVNRAVERAALKTVAAFLNSEGGHLVMGAGNNGEPLGLEADYRTLSRPDADAFENHFTNTFREALGAEHRQSVKLSFHAVDGKELCLVCVYPSARPVYASFENGEQFFIRTGNSTTPLELSKATAYIRRRFKEA